jgi:hypothetical protein
MPVNRIRSTKFIRIDSGVDLIQPNQLWGTDITNIRLPRGFAYLVTIIDWYSQGAVVATVEYAGCRSLRRLFGRGYQLLKISQSGNTKGWGSIQAEILGDLLVDATHE